MSKTNPFIKTTWINEETELSAEQLNRIEQGIYDAYANSLAQEERIDNMLEENSSDTSKRATCDSEGNVITETYATKAQDAEKIPFGDGTGTQIMPDALGTTNSKGFLGKVLQSLNSKIKILLTEDMVEYNHSITFIINPEENNEIRYVLHADGRVQKIFKEYNEQTTLYTTITKNLFLDTLNWIHTYVAEENSKIKIANSNLLDAIISHTSKPSRVNWSSSDAPAALKDIASERADIDTTFATKQQLNNLLAEDTTDTAKKSVADEDGYNIKLTYATKAELSTSDNANSTALENLLANLDLKYNSTNGVTKLVHYTDKANDIYTVLGTIDLPTEFILDSGANKNYYDAVNKEIVLTFKDANNTTIRIPVVNLVDVYSPETTSEITITISAADSTTNVRTIKANINAGSITKSMLASALQTELTEALDGEYGKSQNGTPANPVFGSRMYNENARVLAETSRANAETSRANAEDVRNTNEYGGTGYSIQSPATGSRVANENARIAAEALRVSAESDRISTFSAWDTKVNTTYANTISGYWDSLLALWEAKDSAIDSALADYKDAKDLAIANSISQSLASYESTTTSNLNSAVSNAINTYTTSLESWRTVVNTALGIGASPALDTTLDTLAEIIAYIKEAPNSDYSTLIAHVEANSSNLSAHTNNTTNPHNVTASQVGLGNVTNNKQVKGLASGTTENDILTFGTDGYTVKDSGKSFTTGVRDSSNATDTKVPTEKAVRTELDKKQNTLEYDSEPTTDSQKMVKSGGIASALSGKVDKVTGKVLSDNNYTTDEKNKLGNIEAGAEVNDVVDVKVNGSSVVDGNKVANISVPTSASSSSSSSVNPTTSQFVTSTSTSSITLTFTYSDNSTADIVVVNSVSDNKSNAMTGATVSTTTTTTIS